MNAQRGHRNRRFALSRGFTLLELLLVVALIAMATAGATLALRDSAADALERDAQRLIAQLERARAWARASDAVVVWAPTESGFRFLGLPKALESDPATTGHAWLSPETRVDLASRLLLGPEPVVPPQGLQLQSSADPERSIWVGTDGVRPFAVGTPP